MRAHWLKRATLIAVLVGAAGSVGLFIRAGQSSDEQVLVFVMATWVLSPFGGLVLAGALARNWSELTRVTLQRLMLVLPLGSLLTYYVDALRHPGGENASAFVLVPLVSWVLFTAALAIAALRSRRVSRRRDGMMRDSSEASSTRALAIVLLTSSSSIVGCEAASSPPLASSVPTDAVENLEFGSIDGEGATTFGRISGLLEGPDHRIFVSDYQAHEVRVFSPEGDHLFSFGREGAGPGEMIQPCCLGWGPDGLLWVRDGQNHRYSGFRIGTDSAAFVTQREMAHSDINFWAPLTFHADGSLIDVGHRSSPMGELELTRFHLAPNGDVVRTESLPAPPPEDVGQYRLERQTERGPMLSYLYQPFAPRQIVAHGPSVWAHGLSSSYELQMLGVADSSSIRREMVGPDMSVRESTLARDRIDALVEQMGLSAGQLPFGVPKRKPPVGSAHFDARGNLWVELSVTDGSPHQADVWSPDGQLQRAVRWPANVALGFPGWLGESSALGIRTDSLGVQSVVRLAY